MSVVKLYLVAYNFASAAGWAYVLYLCYLGYNAGASAGELWGTINVPLTYVQTAALMEVVHSLIGVVPSPVFTVFLQVLSRILIVWGITRPFVAAQLHWSLYQTVVAWGLVEVPRYLFYVNAQFGEVVYPLFWLRYSLFMVLYPMGISGEWMQMLTSLKNSEESNPHWYHVTLIIMYVVYTLGGPFMINNMWRNRKSAFKKRAAAKAPAPILNGIQWPITNEKKNERSTSKTNKQIWSASMGAGDDAMKVKLDKTKNWRYGYAKHVENSVKVSLSDPKKALAMARAGLDEAYKQFEFYRNNKGTNFLEAIEATKTTDAFITGKVSGTKQKVKNPVLEVPYGGKDPSQPYYKFKNNKDVLTNGDLIAQLDKWEKHGSIEKSCADEIKAVVQNQGKWLDLSDKYFVLIGATSAMGPLDMLLKYGANIIAIDIDFPRVWETLITKVRNSSGTIYFPIQKAKANGKDQSSMTDEELFKAAGGNLCNMTPELCAWIQTVCPKEAVTVGNYTYLDGELHVRLAIGADAIIQTLCKTRKSTSVAFLCTPTDLHVIPKDAHSAMKANAAKVPFYQKFISMLGTRALTLNAKSPVKTVTGDELYYVDGLSVQQGPNYALAKRLQHWRAIIASSEGHTVSSNIAPSTATKSVVSAPMFAAAYGGFHAFKPLEVLYQETSNAVMFALLIQDVVNPKADCSPKVKRKNPYELFTSGSFHGGIWRCAWTLDSISEVAVMYYFSTKYSTQVIATIGALAAVGYYRVTSGFSLLDVFAMISRQLINRI